MNASLLPPTSQRMSGNTTGKRHYNGTSKLLLTIVWTVCYFFFCLVQQIAEILSPLLLISGLGWSFLPKVISSLVPSLKSGDAQLDETLEAMSQYLPTEITFGWLKLSAASLIGWAIAMMMFVAVMATLSELLATKRGK